MTKQYIEEYFPSHLLNASDIPDGRTLTVTIKEAHEELIGPDKQEKLVLSFREIEKSLALNKTNSVVLSGLYGREISEYTGKMICLKKTPTEYKGKAFMSVRICPELPKSGLDAASMLGGVEIPQ